MPPCVSFQSSLKLFWLFVQKWNRYAIQTFHFNFLSIYHHVCYSGCAFHMHTDHAQEFKLSSTLGIFCFKNVTAILVHIMW